MERDEQGRIILQARGDWKFPNPQHPEWGITWEEPICPRCEDYNAMLRLKDCEDNEVQCRDCGYKVTGYAIQWLATGRIEVPKACLTDEEKGTTTSAQRKKIILRTKIMNKLSRVYLPETSIFKKTSDGLKKLTLDELDSLYVMVFSTTERGQSI